MQNVRKKKALQKIAIVFDRNGQIQLTTVVQETFRYLDSQYFHKKGDVYSFGVVMVKLLTSKKEISFDRPESERNLVITLFL